MLLYPVNTHENKMQALVSAASPGMLLQEERDAVSISPVARCKRRLTLYDKRSESTNSNMLTITIDGNEK